MSRRWAYVIIFVVITLAIWSGWEIYKAFETEKDVEQYSRYVNTIDPDLKVEIIKGVSDLQEKVLVEESEIAPKTTTE